jgi:hypothetical protein
MDYGDGKPHEFPGLTKREYFAAMAMQGYLAGGDGDDAEMQSMAVYQADALIEALNARRAR